MAAYMLTIFIYFAILLTPGWVFCADLNPFDDSQRYDLMWLNKEGDNVNIEKDQTDSTTLSLSGHQYRCKPGTPFYRDYAETLNKPDRPSALLRSLTNLCAIHVDAYWEYEFCYNRHVRQYHTSKDGNPADNAEYILGKHQTASIKEVQDEPVKTLFFNGVLFPYYEETMLDGMVCALTGKPRKTKVHFICARNMALEFVQFSELTTCEYLIIVATQYLCQNPVYRPEEYPVIPLECYPLDSDGPSQPVEQSAFKDQVLKLKASFKSEARDTKVPLSQAKPQVHQAKSGGVDERFMLSFFRGEQCLVGGKGWWKHEVCFGRHVKQFHVDAVGKTEVLLGIWSSQTHNLWFNKNKEKLAKYRHKFVTHYYAKGDFCEEAEKHRVVELRFRCIPQDTINMYLQEPAVCKYILTVESSRFCSRIESALENGLFQQ